MKFTPLAALTGAALVLSGAAAFAGGPNLVVNGSFEANVGLTPGSYGLYNSIPGWSALLNGSYPGMIEIQQENIAGTTPFGSQFLELDSNASSYVYQDLATVIGKTYNFAFAYTKRAGVYDNTFDFSFGGNNGTITLLDTVTQPVNPNWATKTGTFTATSTSTRIAFANHNPSDSYGSYIDNVSVSAVPEPGEWAAMGVFAAGLGGLVVRARRRSK